MLCAGTLIFGSSYSQRQKRLAAAGIQTCWCISISSAGGCTFAQDSLCGFTFSKNSDDRLSELLQWKGYLQNPQPQMGLLKSPF